MDAATIVICLSTGLQIVSALFAAKLLLQPGRRIAGLIALAIILLMAFRRFVSLYRLMTVGGEKTDFFAEGIALTVSLLILAGILYLSRLIQSERKMASMLADSKQHYQFLFNQSPDGVLLIDRKGHILEFNETAARDLGYTREEFSRLHLSDINPFKTREEIQEHIEHIFNNGKAEFEVNHRTKDGNSRNVQVIAQTVDLSGNKVIHAIWRDITERKRAEDALRESQARFQAIFDQNNDGVSVADLEGHYVLVNPAFCRMTGYRQEELLQMRVQDLLPENTEAELFKQVSTEKRSGRREGELRRKDGTRFFVSVSGAVLQIGPKQFVHGIVQDITERKLAEEELREKEEKYQLLFESANDGIFIHDETGFTDCNQKGAEMYGLTKEGIIGRSPGEFAPERQPDGRLSSEVAGEKIRAALSGIPQLFEWQPIRADGTPFDVEITLSRLELGGKICLQAIVRDISKRKMAEEALKESERLLSTLMGNLPGMAYRCRNDRNWTMEYVSEGAGLLTGYEPADFIGNAKIAFNDLIHPDDQGPVWTAVQHAVGLKKKFTLSYRICRADGQERHMWEQGQGVFSEQGDLIALEGFITDVTDRHLLEEERLKTQKLEAIGTLAGGIAHDFNNLLQGIFGYISLAKMTIPEKEQSHAMLEQAEQALHMSVNLTTQLLTFSKGGKPVKTKVHLRPLIENSVRFALSGSRVDYSISSDDDLWAAEVDKGQFGQVIQNIVLNADQAMPDGGTIAITARNVRAPNKGLPHHLTPGKYVEISIGDTGIGIPSKYLQKIFDPYFTTKEKGSGLGLATSYSIVKNHGGLIDAVSGPGTGTTLFIYLPAVEAEKEIDKDFAVSAVVRNGKILIMDDEELVRDIAGALIISLGHEAEVAADGESAVSKYQAARESGTPFDIVILDLTIRGGMGGRETIERLRAIDPGVRAIVSSGYSDNDVIADYQKHGFMACLTKPYNVDNLKKTLNTLLRNEK